jgi:predicted RNA-binding protein with PIN domain
MARWIVDGMNLIGSRPDGWWRDRPGAQRRLAEELAEFAAAGGDEVSVVFDGKPFEIDVPGVEVAFASRRGRDAADDDIAALVAADDQPEGLSVVTSDEGLAGRVRSHGAEVVGAGAFRRRMES